MDIRFNITRPLMAVSRSFEDFVSCPGEPVVPAKEMRISDSGERILVVVGKRDLRAEVQAWKDSTDISVLLARFRAGDPTALNQRKGEFLDCSQFPKTNRDVLNQVIAGRKLFDSLDPAIKQRFDGSFEKWFTSFGDKDWFTRMGVSDDFLSSDVSSSDKPVDPIEPISKE